MCCYEYKNKIKLVATHFEVAIKEILKKKKILEKYYQAAIQNKLENWRKTTRGKLALIIIYDQIPRIIFDENNPKTYATDKLACKITTELFKSSEYKKLSPIEIMFAFLPYHHSENLKHQKIANKIFKELYEKDSKTFEWIYKASNIYNKILPNLADFRIEISV